MKRHHMPGFRATHGTHEFFRHGGSIGCRLTPGRVHKGKRMGGHMGDVKKTVQNLVLLEIDETQNLLLVQGSIPGAPQRLRRHPQRQEEDGREGQAQGPGRGRGEVEEPDEGLEGGRRPAKPAAKKYQPRSSRASGCPSSATAPTDTTSSTGARSSRASPRARSSSSKRSTRSSKLLRRGSACSTSAAGRARGCSTPGAWARRARWSASIATRCEPADPDARVCAATSTDDRRGAPRGARAFDVVLSDMAPDTTGVRSTDQARSEGLFERALEIAELMLAPTATSSASCSRGPTSRRSASAWRARFAEVKMVKPESSRAQSIEIFLAGKGFT